MSFAVANADDRLRFEKDDYGVRGRVGYLAGDTVGRTDSLTHFELMPYARTAGDGLLFSDLRFFFDGDGRFGGNVGLGYRGVFPELERIFGGILWYDIDELSGEQTQQVTVSLESYGPRVDVLGNIYVPVGDDSTGSVSLSNPRFVGNQLVYDQTGMTGDVMGGFDLQVGTLLPGRFAEDNHLRAFAGLYHYQGDTAENVTGFLARLETHLFNTVDAQIKVTNDDTFGTNVLFGVAVGLTAGVRDEWRARCQDSITRYPTRQYNTVVVKDTVNRTGVPAMSAGSGDEYYFTHVASGSSGGNGSVESPFGSISAAQAAGAEMILVHGNSVFSGNSASVVLQEGTTIWGEGAGIKHELEAAGVGRLTVPQVVGGTAPVLRNADSDGVTLASGSHFGGFSIENPAGHGVVAEGIGNAVLSQTSVSGAVQDGVRVASLAGEIRILGSRVSSADGAALHVDGGSGSIVTDSHFHNVSGEALSVSNIDAGQTLDLTGAVFSNSHGSGAVISDVHGDLMLGGLSLADPADVGIEIDGGDGNITFAGDTSISGTPGDALRITNSSAKVSFESLTIAGSGGAAIALENNANTASLTVNGSTTIRNPLSDAISIRNNDGTAAFQAVDIDGRHGGGIVIDQTEGQVQFGGRVSIGNSSAANASAVSITNSAADVIFAEGVTIAGAQGAAAVVLNDNTGTTSFADLDIEAANGSGVQAANAGVVTVLDGDVSVTDGSAFDLDSTDLQISLTSVSVDGGDFGIRLNETNGSFIVNGDQANTPESGGTIQNTTTALIVNNSGVVGFRHMRLTANSNGVQVRGAERFAFWDGTISGATGYAFDAEDIQTLEFVDSAVIDNAMNVRVVTSVSDQAHDWLLSGLNITAGDTAAMTLEATEAQLALQIQNSTVTGTGDDLSLIRLVADHGLQATVTSNQIQSTGNDVALLDLSGGAEPADFRVFNNIFATTGTTATGVRLVTQGPSSARIEQNTVTFANSRGTGLDLSFAGASTVGLYSNLITDNFDGATAVLLRSVVGPANIEIGNNELQFVNLGGLSDRGFIFESVSGQVSLFGDVDNLVGGASTPVFIPAGTTDGSFLVNGNRVP